MKVLVIFSSPLVQKPVRLDREDKVITQLAREFAQAVSVERQHASDIDDIHALITDGGFDVIQFSGHGSPSGLYLEKSDYSGELVSANRFLSLMECADRCPLVILLLCCYSDSSVQTLANAAPFVITSKADVPDGACILFVQGFYERLFRGHSVQNSFDHALHLLTARNLPADSFRLSRRYVIKQQGHSYVESTPDPNRDSILVNLDAVAHRLGSFGMSEDELCHMLARKLRVHSWIFEGVRDKAFIPIGRSLFGEFTWQNAKDVVYCRKIVKLRTDTPRRRWEVWSRVLTSYNDLAASEYRRVKKPADPSRRPMLEDAVRLFKHHTAKYLEPARTVIEELGGLEGLLPHVDMALVETEKAADQLDLGRYPQVVIALELALTNYHEVADGLQPPEEIDQAAG